MQGALLNYYITPSQPREVAYLNEPQEYVGSSSAASYGSYELTVVNSKLFLFVAESINNEQIFREFPYIFQGSDVYMGMFNGGHNDKTKVYSIDVNIKDVDTLFLDNMCLLEGNMCLLYGGDKISGFRDLEKFFCDSDKFLWDLKNFYGSAIEKHDDMRKDELVHYILSKQQYLFYNHYTNIIRCDFDSQIRF